MASAAQAFESPEAAPSLQERMEKRAYELFQERGEQHGFEVEDWLRAEAELTAPASEPADEYVDVLEPIESA
jgi:hypothetical protein